MSHRGRRTLRWTGLAVVVLAAVWAAYRSAVRLAEAGPQIAANRLFLTFLTLAIVVLALGFVGVLIRNLVRLILDRKRGILGSKLRTKLVFFFLALVLLPALLLSYGAAALIKSTVDSLLETPVQDVTRQARALVDDAGRREEQRALHLTERLGQEIAGIPSGAADRPSELERRLNGWLFREGAAAAASMRADGGVEQFVTTRGGDVPFPPLRAREVAVEAGRTALRTGEGVFRVEEVGDGFLLTAAVPWRVYDATGKPKIGGVAVFATAEHRETARRMDAIATAQLAYDEFRAERREVLRLYYSLIALIGLGTVFVASWIGLSMARRITTPIQQVAAATREIAEGNLGVRVDAATGDEVGMLVDAFNDMAAQLQESREVITRSTADLRRTNQALDERRRYVETLLASLSTGVLSLDRNGRVTTANPAAASILGVKIVSGDDLRSLLDAPGLAPLLASIDEILAGGQAERRDLVLHRLGDAVSVSVQVAPLRGGRGEDLGTLVVVEDLTDLLRAQKAMAWQEVARRIAHEIKNPLTPIQLSVQRLRKKWTEGAADLGPVVDAATASIEQEVAVLKRLVDEFSRYARMPEPSPEPVDLAKLIESVLALYRGHPGVSWEAEVAPELGPVRVDPEQMRRVLVNLLDNAVAAMRGQGWVRVAARPWNGPGSVHVEVEDDGPGVSLPQRERLFEPYFSTKPRGTGLGLAIVHRIVTEHHGTIRVEDGARGGLRFVIEIPGGPPGAAAGAE